MKTDISLWERQRQAELAAAREEGRRLERQLICDALTFDARLETQSARQTLYRQIIEKLQGKR